MKRIDDLPIKWSGDRVILLDQTRLPQEEVYLELDDYRSVASAIKELRSPIHRKARVWRKKA